MSAPLVLALIWCIAANVIGMFPCKNRHWPQAYALIAIGLPLLVWLFVVEGWLVALVIFIAALSILRWPVRYLMRWGIAIFWTRQEPLK